MCLSLLLVVTSPLIDPTHLSKHLSWTSLTKGLTSLLPSSIQFYYLFSSSHPHTIRYLHPYLFVSLGYLLSFQRFPFPDCYQHLPPFHSPSYYTKSRFWWLPEQSPLYFVFSLVVPLIPAPYPLPLSLLSILPASWNTCITALVRNFIPESAYAFTKIPSNLVYLQHINHWQFLFSQSNVNHGCLQGWKGQLISWSKFPVCFTPHV